MALPADRPMEPGETSKRRPSLLIYVKHAYRVVRTLWAGAVGLFLSCEMAGNGRFMNYINHAQRDFLFYAEGPKVAVLRP